MNQMGVFELYIGLHYIYLNQVQLDGRGPGVDQFALQGREDGKEDESPVQV